MGGWGGSNGGGNQALDDAMDRFGGMTLGSSGSNVAGGGADDLDMGSLRLAEGEGGGGGGFGLSAVPQVRYKQKQDPKTAGWSINAVFPQDRSEIPLRS